MEPLLKTTDRTRIRLFRDSDTESVRQIFMQAMLYDSNSPTHLALKRQPFRRPSLVMYVLFTIGLFLTSHPATRIPGILLSVGTAALFFSWRWNSWSRFKKFYQSALDQDLSDIGKNYEPEPSAFWVAELSEGSEAGTVIGCVGLGVPTTQDPTVIELRRMVVSPKYQRHGVGTLLLTTAIAHARAHGLSKIKLSTSMYQETAMRLYEKFGFVEERKIEAQVKFLFLVSKAYLYFYGLKL